VIGKNDTRDRSSQAERRVGNNFAVAAFKDEHHCTSACSG
jgi:hypothetical protein